MSFGKRLELLMKDNNISRETLAKKLGLSYWTVSKYITEKRFPDSDTVNKIADIFNVSTDYLLGRTDDPTPPGKSKDPFSDLPKDAQIFFKDFDKLSDEDKKKVAEHIKFLLHLAEQENKKQE